MSNHEIVESIREELGLNDGELQSQEWIDLIAQDIGHLEVVMPSLRWDTKHWERTDAFFEKIYSQLFIQVFDLVRAGFAGDGHLEDDISPWAAKHPAEFYEYVKVVANPDPNSGHWEGLLRNEAERVFLLTGVVMRALDEKVLSSLMFGANAKHRAALRTHDIDLVNVEGFGRTRLLSQMNQAYLGENKGYPPKFAHEVKRVTAQIWLMLLPMYNLVGAAYPRYVKEVDILVQMLFETVAYAAWINVMTRVSPEVVTIEWMAPGDEYHMSQANLDQEIYLDSMQKAEERDERRKTRVSRMARIKISSSPRIRRLAIDENDAGKPGHSVCTLLKPHVVYYEGLLSPIKDRGTLTSLKEHVLDVGGGRGSLSARLIVLLAISLPVLLLWLLISGNWRVLAGGLLRMVWAIMYWIWHSTLGYLYNRYHSGTIN